MADVSTSEQCSQEINRKNLGLISQSVKEPLLSASESRDSSVSCWEMDKNEGEIGVLPTPLGQLFQIHGNIFKPDPPCDCGQASVVCITHCVFLFCIRKDTLNRLFPSLVHPLVDRSVTGIVGQFFVVFPMGRLICAVRYKGMDIRELLYYLVIYIIKFL